MHSVRNSLLFEVEYFPFVLKFMPVINWMERGLLHNRTLCVCVCVCVCIRARICVRLCFICPLVSVHLCVKNRAEFEESDRTL